MRRPEQLLSNLLKEKKLTISFAESITCGLLAHKFGTISGTADVLNGSIVCYTEKVKINLLKVKKSLIDKYTAESQQVTDSLAKNLQIIIESDIHAAITGLAAPGGSETKSKPVGTVFYSWIFKGKVYKMKKRFYGSPLEIKDKACEYLFRFILKQLKKSFS